MIGDVRSHEQCFDLKRQGLKIICFCSNYESSNNRGKTDLLHVLAQTSTDVFVERRPDLSSSNVLERREDRVLHFSFDGHFDDPSGVPRKLGGDKLQDLLLASEIFSLLVCTGVFETMICIDGP